VSAFVGVRISGFEKRLWTFPLVPFHAATDAVFRNAKGVNDLHLFAHPLANQLSREHSE